MSDKPRKIEPTTVSDETIIFKDRCGNSCHIRLAGQNKQLLAIGVEAIHDEALIKKVRAFLSKPDGRLNWENLPPMLIDKEFANVLIDILCDWVDHGVLALPEQIEVENALRDLEAKG